MITHTSFFFFSFSLFIFAIKHFSRLPDFTLWGVLLLFASIVTLYPISSCLSSRLGKHHTLAQHRASHKLLHISLFLFPFSFFFFTFLFPLFSICSGEMANSCFFFLLVTVFFLHFFTLYFHDSSSLLQLVFCVSFSFSGAQFEECSCAYVHVPTFLFFFFYMDAGVVSR